MTLDSFLSKLPGLVYSNTPLNEHTIYSPAINSKLNDFFGHSKSFLQNVNQEFTKLTAQIATQIRVEEIKTTFCPEDFYLSELKESSFDLKQINNHTDLKISCLNLYAKNSETAQKCLEDIIANPNLDLIEKRAAELEYSNELPSVFMERNQNLMTQTLLSDDSLQLLELERVVLKKHDVVETIFKGFLTVKKIIFAGLVELEKQYLKAHAFDPLGKNPDPLSIFSQASIQNVTTDQLSRYVFNNDLEKCLNKFNEVFVTYLNASHAISDEQLLEIFIKHFPDLDKDNSISQGVIAFLQYLASFASEGQIIAKLVTTDSTMNFTVKRIKLIPVLFFYVMKDIKNWGRALLFFCLVSFLGCTVLPVFGEANPFKGPGDSGHGPSGGGSGGGDSGHGPSGGGNGGGDSGQGPGGDVSSFLDKEKQDNDEKISQQTTQLNIKSEFEKSNIKPLSVHIPKIKIINTNLHDDLTSNFINKNSSKIDFKNSQILDLNHDNKISDFSISAFYPKNEIK